MYGRPHRALQERLRQCMPSNGGKRLWISRNLSGRLERLEDSLLPVLEEPLVIKIISVSSDGQRVDSGIEFKGAVRSEAVQKERLW